MKTILTALLSLLTLIGGHFVNRRWDRAVLFLALSLTFIFVSYIVLLLGVNSSEPQDYFKAYLTVLNVIGVGMLVILIISAVVTVYDKRNEHALSQTKFTLSGKVGASLLSFFSAALLILFTVGYITVTNISSKFSTADDGSISSGEDSSWYDKHFYSNLKFGNGRYLAKPKKLLEGKGYLVGYLSHAGKPAVGVKLKLQLNDEYESEALLTDDKGQFVLRLPVGEWDVTHLAASSWEGKPKGKFLLVSGYEPKFKDRPYHSYQSSEGSGLNFNVTATKPEKAHMSFKINPYISFNNKYKNRKPVELSLNEDKIEWAKYAGASQYQVEVSRVKKGGGSTFYLPVSYRTVKSNSSILLKDLASSKIQTDNNDKDAVYNVDVTAFSEDGSFLSKTEGFRSYSFKLKDSAVLLAENSDGTPRIDGSMPNRSERKKNKKRFDAIELLIDEKLYKAAKKLLQADMKGATPGKKEALWGYYYASQKKCKKAQAFFSKASEIGGAKCVISEHEKLCL